MAKVDQVEACNSTLYAEFGVMSDKSIRQGDFAEVMAFLDDWYQRMTKHKHT